MHAALGTQRCYEALFLKHLTMYLWPSIEKKSITEWATKEWVKLEWPPATSKKGPKVLVKPKHGAPRSVCEIPWVTQNLFYLQMGWQWCRCCQFNTLSMHDSEQKCLPRAAKCLNALGCICRKFLIMFSSPCSSIHLCYNGYSIVEGTVSKAGCQKSSKFA